MTEAGVPDLTIKLDWLDGSFPAGNVEQVRALLVPFLGEPEHHDYGLNFYRAHWAWSVGAKLCYSPGRQDAWLSLNASALNLVPLVKLRPFCQALQICGVRAASRIDVALDDYSRRISIDQVEQAYRARQVVGFKLGNRIRPERIEDAELVPEGDSYNLGRRGRNGSGRFLCIYDKGLESGGVIDCIRWELRLSIEAAGLAWQRLCAAVDDAAFVVVLRELVGGAVDFKDDPGETHLDRRPRLAWWQAMLDVLGAARLVVHRVEPPLQAALLHFKKTWAKTLALGRCIMDGEGYDFMAMVEEWIQEGERKIDWQRSSARFLGLDVVALTG